MRAHRPHPRPPPALLSILALLVLSLAPAVTSAAAQPTLAVDWKSFLSKHDPVWEFAGAGAALPTRWIEASFVGDGLLGASLRVLDRQGKSKDALAVHMHVGRSDLWDQRSGKSKLSMGNNMAMDRPKLPVGLFALPLAGKTIKVRPTTPDPAPPR